MKTLTQLHEDFKISRNTKIGDNFIKVVAIYRKSTNVSSFDKCSNYLFCDFNNISLIMREKGNIKLRPNLKYLFAGMTPYKSGVPFQKLKDVDDLTKKHEWHEIGTQSFKSPEHTSLYMLYSTTFDYDDWNKLNKNNAFEYTIVTGYTYCKGTNIENVINKLIEQGYLDDTQA